MTHVSELLESKQDGHVYCIDQSATALDAARIMDSRHIGCLVVISEGKMAGILTERDLLGRVMARQRDPEKTLVSEVMTRRVLRCGPDAEVDEACRAMDGVHVKHLPVMGPDDRCIGVISTHDVERWIRETQGRDIEYLREYICGRI